jgi:hypothetical protein
MSKRLAYAISTLACLLLVLPSASFVVNQMQVEKAYADEIIERDLSSFGKIQVITEDNRKYEFDRDFEVELVDDEDIFKDSDAEKANNMKFKRGETLTVELPRPSEEADSVSPTFCLADKHQSDNSIAKSENERERCGPDGINLEVEGCPDISSDECKNFEVVIPDDIDRGKYKVVITSFGTATDTQDIFINKVRIK